MLSLDPKSIAVIGASDEPKKLGHYVLSNLLKQGYKGKVYPVNPKHEKVMGKKAYAAATDIPGPVDMAVVVTPASTVGGIAKACAQKGVKTLVVISAGFSELKTEEGKKMETDLAAIAKRAGMRLLGPNCLGLLRPAIGLNASFAHALPPRGSIALISQSGALAVALMDEAAAVNAGFSLVASIGNKADLDEVDLLESCAADPETNVIGLYLESIEDGRQFVDTAARIQQTKPVVLIKSGTSLRGQAAVSSHTGALAGSATAVEAACEAAGIVHAQTTEEFLDALRTLASQPKLLSKNIAIVTNAGGPGVLATDAAERAGLHLPPLTEEHRIQLKTLLPPAASVANPIDVLGDALADRYAAAVAACAKDPAIDGIAVVLTPQVMTPSAEIAAAIVNVARTHPLIPIVTSFMGGSSVEDARRELATHGVPSFASPEAAVRALSVLAPRNPRLPAPLAENADDRSSTASAAVRGHDGLLPEAIAADLLSLYRLPLPEESLARTADEAVARAREIGYPVVMKVSSPDILHKTEIGAVRVNLRNEKEVRRAHAEILENCRKHAPTAGVAGVLIQQFLPAGSEFIIGGIRDPSFGPLVMVGLGGIYTELFRDSAFALAPVSEECAFGLLEKLASWRLLTGMRGKEPKDIASLAEAVSSVAMLMAECDEVTELDLNPVFVSEHSLVVADAKVIVRPRPAVTVGKRPRSRAEG